jgi:hypothetical protein
VSRPSTNSGLKGGGGVEAEHRQRCRGRALGRGRRKRCRGWRRRRRRHRGRQAAASSALRAGLGFMGHRKIVSLMVSRGNSPGLGFVGPGGPGFISGSLFVSPQILLFVSVDLGQPIPTISHTG